MREEKMKVKCISCHKKFDYDIYYGLCPKCGAYNAKPAAEAHKELDKEHADISAVLAKVMTLAAAVVIVLCLAGIFTLLQKQKTAPETADVEAVRASAGDMLSYGDYQYNVQDAVIMTDAEEDGRLPAHTKLLAVSLMMIYKGDKDNYRDRFMPYLYDGEKYVEASESSELAEIAGEYGLEGELLYSYSVYSGTQDGLEGCILYLVDENCGDITINLECREDTYLERVYEVTLTPYDRRDGEGFESWDGWDDWYDYDPFYDFDDYFNWFDDYNNNDDDYDYGVGEDYDL